MIYRDLLVATVLAAGLALQVPAQNVRVTNMANVARKQWVDIAVPIVDGAALPEFCRLEPYGFPVWKGAHVGLHSTMFHALVDLGPDETITGHLVGAALAPGQAPDHTMSDWVDDDTVRVIPRPVVFVGGRERRLEGIAFKLAERNRARQVYHLRARVAGTPLVCDQWIYIYTKQDPVRFEMTLTNSDPRSSDLSFSFDWLWLETGELSILDYRELQSFAPPIRQTAFTTHPSHDWWITMLSGARAMGRGEQIYISGTLLCQPSPGHAPAPMSYAVGGTTTTWTVAERDASLTAASRAPVVGVCLDWDGKWLAYGMVPEVPAGAGNGGWDAADASANGFRSYQLNRRDLYAQRPRGLQQRAGSTGAQEDFGASKASYAVTVGDPRFLHELGYSVYELFARPFHNREVDGTPMLQTNHPGLTTWSQFVHCFTTQDRLGLPCPLPFSWANSGWSGMDDQHRSQNNANAWLALTGSHAMRAAFKDMLEIDLAQVPGRVDSPRGEGRLHLAWANMLMLLDDHFDRVRLYAHVQRRMDTLLSQWLGRRFVNDPTRPIRALSVGSDPSFVNAQNERIPALIVWEHSIAAMGFYAGWRITGDPRFHDMAVELSRMIVERCFFQEGGRWIACTAIRYLQGADEGRALPASSYYLGSPDIHAGLDFYEWIAPAVLICRDLHRYTDPTLAARCDQILANRGAPMSWQRSEWWAVLPR